MVPKQGGILPGDAADKYLRVPVLALLVLAPMMGAVYAMFLPFIGFAMLFSFLGKKAFGVTRRGRGRRGGDDGARAGGLARPTWPEKKRGDARTATATRPRLTHVQGTQRAAGGLHD